jgi:undecaprenyl-phosphate 4-deoxy-4-formamido-L-arabinose transferase
MSSALPISLVIPAFNERGNLPELLRSCTEVLDRYPGAHHEVVIVDDGSTDGTGEYLDEAASRDPRIRPIHHTPEERIGCHPSELVALRAARGEVAVFLPADLQIRPDVVPLFYDRAVQGADIVASRRITRADNAWRRFLSGANNAVERMVMGVRVHDAHSSMAFSRRAIERIAPLIVSSSALIPAEFLVRAKRMGMRIDEVDIPHFPREAGVQRGSSLREVRGVPVDLLRLTFRLRREMRRMPADVAHDPLEIGRA